MTQDNNNSVLERYKSVLDDILELPIEVIQEAYDHAVAKVREVVNGAPTFDTYAQQAGNPPEKTDYGLDKPMMKEYLNAADLTHWMMLVVIIAVFFISAVHVTSFMNTVADNAYTHDVKLFCGENNDSCGLIVSRGVWNAIHIIGSMLLTEIGSLLFSVFFFQRVNKLEETDSYWRTILTYSNLVAAIFLALFSIVVNVLSLAGPYFARGDNLSGVFVGLLGALIPIIVLILGEQIYEFLEKVGAERSRRIEIYEKDNQQYLENLQLAQARYQQALLDWSNYRESPVEHPKFNEYFVQTILAKYSEQGRMYRVNDDGKRVTVRIPASIIRSPVGKLLAARTIASYRKLENVEDMIDFFD